MPAPSLSIAASALKKRAVPRCGSYLSTAHSVSKLPSASSVVASPSGSSNNSGSKSSPSSSSASSSNNDGNNNGSNSSGSSSSGSSGNGSASMSTTLAAQEGKVDLVAASHAKGGKAASSKSSVKSANPPPSSLASVAYEAFFSNGRPLLQHEMLPPRPKHPSAALFASASAKSGSTGASQSSGASGSLTAFFVGDGTLAAFGSTNSFDTPPQWRRRIRAISPERFAELVDELAGIESQAAKDASVVEGATEPRWLISSFNPQSDQVALESAKLEEEERLKEEEDEAVESALERGEDPDVARKLGAEADLVVLGEPNGPSPDWSRGVATYLAEKGRAYEAPPAPRQQAAEEIEASGEAQQQQLMEGEDAQMIPHVSKSVFFTDDDANLILSHAMVQTTLPLALKWDRLVSQMDAVALGKPLRALEGIDLTKLNARIPEVSEPRSELEAHDIKMDSVRRKRRKKIRKHKYKKLRKEQRAERQRMKK